jgi:tRNA (cmo5U34)-methyltransferase
MQSKSTVEEIRDRFDHDVERFSNLDTGQATVPDSRYMWELVAQVASTVTPHARDMLDIGCGAGNDSLYMLGRIPNLNITLIDLSSPMLARAVERLREKTSGKIMSIQKDVRDVDMEQQRYDIIVAGFSLHHLRGDDEWAAMFEKIFAALRPGGSFWLVDMFEFDVPSMQQAMWQRYGDYLVELKDEAYRDKVFAYVQKEDSPRSTAFVTDQLRVAGFNCVEILHKKLHFAAMGAVK